MWAENWFCRPVHRLSGSAKLLSHAKSESVTELIPANYQRFGSPTVAYQACDLCPRPSPHAARNLSLLDTAHIPGQGDDPSRNRGSVALLKEERSLDERRGYTPS